MAQACIICHEFKPGLLVEDTLVVRSIRWLKQNFAPIQLIWGKPSGNTLVVCTSCLAVYQKRRKSYERKMLFYAAFAFILVLFIALSSIFAGSFNLASILAAIMLGALLMLLGLLDYVPPLAASAQASAKEILSSIQSGAANTAKSDANAQAQKTSTMQEQMQAQPPQPQPQAQAQEDKALGLQQPASLSPPAPLSSQISPSPPSLPKAHRNLKAFAKHYNKRKGKGGKKALGKRR
jgi:hypothetical protein